MTVTGANTNVKNIQTTKAKKIPVMDRKKENKTKQNNKNNHCPSSTFFPSIVFCFFLHHKFWFVCTIWNKSTNKHTTHDSGLLILESEKTKVIGIGFVNKQTKLMHT